MRNEFKAYYQSKNELDIGEIWKNDKTIFVFDTNVLINLYRYKKETVDDFIKLVKALKDRVFIPYHVGLEYHRNRLKPIIENRSELNKLSSELSKCWDNEKFKKLIDSRSVNKHPLLAKLLQEISQTFDEQKTKVGEEIKNISQKELHVTAQDSIRENILEIFDGNLGKAPESQTWLDELYKEGEERYKNEIPPGYKDQNKDLDETAHFQYKNLIYKRKFGDLIIWKQILEYVSIQENIDNVVFVTDDSKEDWMYRVNSQGNKIIGARIELIDEYLQEKPDGIFSAYSSEEFVDNGNKVFNLDIAEDSVADVKSNILASDATFDVKSILCKYNNKIKYLKQKEGDLILKKISLQSNKNLYKGPKILEYLRILRQLDKEIEDINKELIKIHTLDEEDDFSMK